MARRHAVIFDEQDLSIPEDAFTFEGFERWEESDEFPAPGRIDFLAGDIQIDMSPEDLYTHGVVKTAIILKIGTLLAEKDLGDIFTDSTRLRSRFADLSVEPDIVVVLESSLETGKVRLVPASRAKGPDRYAALEGPTDVVIEIVSDSSVKKDTKRLPLLYAAAGVPELWIVDARGRNLRFEIHALQDGRYVPAPADAEGWLHSSRLNHAFRLDRQRRSRSGTWRYKLEHRAP